MITCVDKPTNKFILRSSTNNLHYSSIVMRTDLHTQSSHQGVRYFSENLQYLFAGSSFGSLTAIFGTLCPAGAIGTDLNLHLRFDTGK
jgi:hypothetical protein